LNHHQLVDGGCLYGGMAAIDILEHEPTSKPNQVLIDGTTMANEDDNRVLDPPGLLPPQEQDGSMSQEGKEDEVKFEDFVNHGKWNSLA
jgi:hypothetical protein